MQLRYLYIQSLVLWALVTIIVLGAGITIAMTNPFGNVGLSFGVGFVFNWSSVFWGVKYTTRAVLNLIYLNKGPNAKLNTRKFEG